MVLDYGLKIVLLKRKNEKKSRFKIQPTNINTVKLTCKCQYCGRCHGGHLSHMSMTSSCQARLNAHAPKEHGHTKTHTELDTVHRY